MASLPKIKDTDIHGELQDVLHRISTEKWHTIARLPYIQRLMPIGELQDGPHRMSAAAWRSTAGRPPRRLIRRQPWRSAGMAKNEDVPSSCPAGPSRRLHEAGFFNRYVHFRLHRHVSLKCVASKVEKKCSTHFCCTGISQDAT